MNKNLIIILIFFLALVVYLSLLKESKIEALGFFFHPIAWAIIFMLGRETLKRFFDKEEK